MLALKPNQPQRYDDVVAMFDCAKRSAFSGFDHHFAEMVEKGHSRIEQRRCGVVSNPAHIAYVNDHHEWARLRSLVLVEAERTELGKRFPVPLRHSASAERGAATAVQRQNPLGD